jgi:hypothetical protein
MAFKIRRGTNAERLTITPAQGELIYTTDTKKIYIGDGTTVGGTPVDSVLPISVAGNNLVFDPIGNVFVGSATTGANGTVRIHKNIEVIFISWASFYYYLPCKILEECKLNF